MADFCDFRVFKYFSAARACAFGQCLCDIHGIGIAIAWDMNTAHHIIDIDDVRELFDLFGCHDMDRQIKNLRHWGAAFQLFKPFCIGRHRYRATLAIARRLPRFGFQPAIQFACIFGELGHVD